MPYFIFQITNQPESTKKELKHIETFDKYRPAREYCRNQRAHLTDEKSLIKMIHAGSISEAEILLTTTREAPIIGDD